VRASARIVARCQPDGATRLTTLAGEAPLLLRRTGQLRPGQDTARPDAASDPARAAARRTEAQRPPAQVHLVGGAAGPLGGDELRCSVDLGPGARLEVRSVAASVALPGPHGRESSLEIHARIGEGGALSWSPQPLIAARGARHRTMTRVELAADARLVWREELILGRDGEDPGSICTRLRVIRDGRVLLDHEVTLGPRHPGSLGPSGTGGHRALGTVLIVDPAWDEAEGAGAVTGLPQIPTQDDKRVAIAAMRLSGPAFLISAAAIDGLALGRVLDTALQRTAM
jgi:urease accessory protein